MALPLFAVLDAKRGLLDATLVSPRFRCIIPDDRNTSRLPSRFFCNHKSGRLLSELQSARQRQTTRRMFSTLNGAPARGAQRDWSETDQRTSARANRRFPDSLVRLDCARNE